MPITSHDIARAAGVSQGTVSRALRGEPGVSESTRERIRRIAEAMAYVPSEAGRSLSTRSTRRIGVVAAELTNPFYPQLLEPLQDRLDQAGYRTLLIADRGERPVEIGRLVDGSLDGVVLTTTAIGSRLPHELELRGIPYVLVNREVDGVRADSCSVDNRGGAIEVAHLLAGLGHDDVAMIAGPEDTSTGRDREAGFRYGLSEHGLPLRRSAVYRGAFSYATGRSGMLRLLDGPAPPTAVFCANDVIAMGACNAAAACGVRLPTDLTIVGFDDIAMASWDLFQLTTVHSALSVMAQTAVRLLLERIRNPRRDPERVVLRPTLVLRATHGPRSAPDRH